MANQLADLDVLPKRFGSLAADFRCAAGQMACRSAQGLRECILPTNVFIRNALLQIHLFITRTEERLLFGFIRRRQEKAVIMDVAVSLRFEISDREFRGIPFHPESVLHTAIVPPFFLSDIPVEEAQKAAYALNASCEEIFFVRLDAGILGVVQPEDPLLAKAAWQRREGNPWVRVDKRTSTGSKRSLKWSVPPFLALARTVGLWIKQGSTAGEPVPVSLPSQTKSDSEKIPLYLLRQLTSAWMEAANGLRGSTVAPDKSRSALEAWRPEYDTAGFEAKVLLRLDAKGRLAYKGDREDLFLLQASLRLEEDEPGVPRSTISIGPPDFLGGGALYDAFLDCLDDPEAARLMAEKLGLNGQEYAIHSFIQSARSRPFDAPLVFRVKQGKHDTDVITLHGTLNNLLQHVVLSAEFDVEAGEEPRVTLRPKTLEVLYTDRPGKGSPEPHGNEIVEYFLRLLTNLRNWHGSIK